MWCSGYVAADEGDVIGSGGSLDGRPRADRRLQIVLATGGKTDARGCSGEMSTDT